jgi:hypothetical protein
MTDSKLYDVDAAIEEKASTEEPFPFRCGGKKFYVPVQSKWPDSLYSVPQTGDIVGATRDALGKDYERFVEAGGTAAKFMLAVDAMTKRAGTTVGESPASADS